MVCARRDFPISRLTSDQHDNTVAGLHLLPAPHQQRDLFLRTCGSRMQLTTRNLARLRELYDRNTPAMNGYPLILPLGVPSQFRIVTG
jgi:hypothetical protein